MPTKKPKRMFVMAEFETTLTAKELHTALQEHLTGHGAHVEKFSDEGDGCSVRAISLMQVHVNVARPHKGPKS
jgi:hypothetical protein